MKQKFRKLTFVKVTDKMPTYMSHFDCGFTGIVDGTYSQMYGGGGDSLKQYSLFKIEENTVVDQIAWYNEEQLTALKEQDTLKAEEMIEEYQTTA
jgi:hypothetical protein